jgi:subtilisin family serine protease
MLSTAATLVRRTARLAVVLAALTAVAWPSAGSAGTATTHLLVKFKVNAPAGSLSSALHAARAEQVSTISDIGVHVLSAPTARVSSALAALRALPAVQYAEADGLVRTEQAPNDPWWPNESSEVHVNAPKAWDYTTGSANVVIAVLDTGVDATTPDLQGALVPGWDFVNNDSDTSDDNGHGTMVASIAAARSNNAAGIASYCWGCMVMPVKVMSANGTGLQSALASGITWAADHGAKVISMSVSGPAYSALASAVQYAESKGVILVAAAGNSGSSSPTYPAAYPGVIGVAGANPDDTLNSSSNFGSWVTVAAPWCNYAASMRQSNGSYQYAALCGTSSATPAVAGIVGLLASQAPGASASQIARALTSSAVPETFVAYGRVDAYAAMLALGAGSGSTGSPPSASAAPAISGTDQAGQTLTASSGTWSGSTPMTYSYKWQRCDSSGSSCADVSGATSTTYVLSSADVGCTVRIVVTASNAYGTSSTSSTLTPVIAAAPAPPATTSTSSFSGTLTKGQASRSYTVTAGSGSASASLSFGKASTLTLTVQAANGSVVGSASGPSIISFVSNLSAGTYTYVVSGGPGNVSFMLTVAYPTP